MTPQWHNLVGTVGVAAIVVTYLLLQLGRIDPRGLPYSGLNALGSALILVSLTVHFNLSAAVIEAFWLAISLYGMGAWARRRALPPDHDPSG